MNKTLGNLPSLAPSDQDLDSSRRKDSKEQKAPQEYTDRVAIVAVRFMKGASIL
jgi:hypothetical protein